MHNPPKLINPRTAIYACGGCLLEFRAIIGHPVCPLCGEVDQAVRLKSTPCKTMNIEYGYEIEARSAELGGGWRLRLLEDGEEMGGGVFPLAPYLSDADGNLFLALDLAYMDAKQVAVEWLDSRPGDDTGPR